MAKLKSLETISVIILNWFAMIATKIGRQNCSKWNAIFESHVETCIDWTSFNFWFHYFFYQSATQNNGLLCYWPSIHHSILKIWITFQMLSSHFSEVNELLNEHWAKNVKWKYFNSNSTRAIQEWQSCMQFFLFRDLWIIQRLSVAMSAAWVSSKF